jgi:hypothetical protein
LTEALTFKGILDILADVDVLGDAT